MKYRFQRWFLTDILLNLYIDRNYLWEYFKPIFLLKKFFFHLKGNFQMIFNVSICVSPVPNISISLNSWHKIITKNLIDHMKFIIYNILLYNIYYRAEYWIKPRVFWRKYFIIFYWVIYRNAYSSKFSLIIWIFIQKVLKTYL